MTRRFFYLETMLVLLLLCALPAAVAQDTSQIKDDEVTVENIRHRIEEIKKWPEDTADRAETKKKSLEFLENALVQLAAMEKYAAETEKYAEIIQSAPGILQKLKERPLQAEDVAARLKPVLEEGSLDLLPQLLQQAEADLKGAKKEGEALQIEERQRIERRSAIPSAIVAARRKLEEMELTLGISPAPDEEPESVRARYTLLIACRKAVAAEIDAYDKELASYDARKDLLPLRQKHTAVRVAELEEQSRLLREAVNRRRRMEAEQIAQQAREEARAAEKDHPAVRKLKEENAGLADLRRKIATRIEEVSRECQDIERRLEEVRKDFRGVQEKVKAVGMTNVVGLLLRKKEMGLPDIRKQEVRIDERQAEIASVQFDILEMDELKATLEGETGYILSGFELTPEERTEIEDAVSEQLRAKHRHIEELLENYEIYIASLADLDARERDFVRDVSEYISYIEERILWVRSSATIHVSDGKRALKGLSWLLQWQNWAELLRALGSQARESPVLFALAILVFAALVSLKRRARAKLEDLAGLIKKIKTDSFAYTIQALLISLAIAMTWPFLFLFIGWRLGNILQTSEFISAVASGLIVTAEVYATFAVLRAILLPRGLAEAHFRWDETVTAALRSSLLWFMTVSLPLVFTAYTMNAQMSDIWNDSLGRMAFIAGMLVLSLFFAGVFRPSGKLMQSGLIQWRLLDRSRYLWYTFLVSLPFGMAALSAIGYYYTAFHLQQKLWETSLFLLALLIIYAVLLRWMFFIRRSLWMARKLITLVTAAEDAPKGTARAAPEPAKKEAVLEDDASIVLIQGRRLLRSLCILALVIGIWFIWSDVLPAFKILKRIGLWDDVTLSDLVYAILIVAVTAIAAKNVPAIVEIFSVKRLRLEKSMGFAVASLTRYAIMIVGFVACFHAIGIGWSKLQWLVAALTFGLAFGLQEIVANFVSGIIILFERPMRVGDTVTIGDTSGTVTKIQIRATTITDWDRKELIVPNKEFITSKLVNWTLSDTVLRIVIPVGIAYGSDTEKSCHILRQVAREHPNVMADPKTRVLFKGFGESSLDFELRVFVPDIDLYLDTLHDLNMAIDREFRRAGIEIAFPQRDIHVRSVDAVFPFVDKLQSE